LQLEQKQSAWRKKPDWRKKKPQDSPQKQKPRAESKKRNKPACERNKPACKRNCVKDDEGLDAVECIAVEKYEAGLDDEDEDLHHDLLATED